MKLKEKVEIIQAIADNEMGLLKFYEAEKDEDNVARYRSAWCALDCVLNILKSNKFAEAMKDIYLPPDKE